MNKKYVDVDEIKKRIHCDNPEMHDYKTLMAFIDHLQAADVAPVVHAYWIDTDDYINHYGHVYECSNCHREVADDFIAKHTYCLHCGAKMDERIEKQNA